jgi:hypothetical protein
MAGDSPSKEPTAFKDGAFRGAARPERPTLTLFITSLLLLAFV